MGFPRSKSKTSKSRKWKCWSQSLAVIWNKCRQMRANFCIEVACRAAGATEILTKLPELPEALIVPACKPAHCTWRLGGKNSIRLWLRRVFGDSRQPRGNPEVYCLHAFSRSIRCLYGGTIHSTHSYAAISPPNTLNKHGQLLTITV